MHVNTLLSRLKNVRQTKPGAWQALCPAHDDRKVSLSIAEQDGKILVHCFAGCNTADVLRAIGLTERDLFADAKPAPMTPVARAQTPTDGLAWLADYCAVPRNFLETLPLRATDGYIEFVFGDGLAVKRRKVGEKLFTWAPQGAVAPPLWPLPESKLGDEIWLCEGETDAIVTAYVGLPAYAVTKGAGTPLPIEQVQALKARGCKRIILVYDVDKAGQDGAKKQIQILQSAGIEVAQVDLMATGLADLLAGRKDVRDIWRASQNRDEMRQALVAAVAEVEPVEEMQKDYGHAAVLATLFRNRYRWAVHRSTWMRYDAGVWRPVPEELVAKAAADALRQHYATKLVTATDKATVLDLTKKIAETCTYARIEGALCFLRGWEGILTTAEEWDVNPWLLNVQNGTLDLQTFTLRPHDPSDLLTKQAGAEYDPHAMGNRWQAHIEMFLPDPDVRRQVQRDLGLSLVGASLAEVIPIWYGIGANGKSTTLRVIMAILGDYTQIAAPKLLLQSKYERHTTELAELQGRRLIFSSETGAGSRLDEERVKWLTGGENIRARFMRCDNIEFQRSWIIVLVTNHKPAIQGTDNGIWRRIRLIPWTFVLPPEMQKPQEIVIHELIAESAAILNWLVAGLRDWLDNPAWIANGVQDATAQYRQEQDRLAGFLTEQCEFHPNAMVGVGVLYDAYTQWCEEANEEALGKRAFSERLRDKGLTQQRVAHERSRKWVGIRLRSMRTNADNISISPLEKNFSRGNMDPLSAFVRSGNSDKASQGEGMFNPPHNTATLQHLPEDANVGAEWAQCSSNGNMRTNADNISISSLGKSFLRENMDSLSAFVRSVDVEPEQSEMRLSDALDKSGKSGKSSILSRENEISIGQYGSSATFATNDNPEFVTDILDKAPPGAIDRDQELAESADDAQERRVLDTLAELGGTAGWATLGFRTGLGAIARRVCERLVNEGRLFRGSHPGSYTLRDPGS